MLGVASSGLNQKERCEVVAVALIVVEGVHEFTMACLLVDDCNGVESCP